MSAHIRLFAPDAKALIVTVVSDLFETPLRPKAIIMGNGFVEVDTGAGKYSFSNMQLQHMLGEWLKKKYEISNPRVLSLSFGSRLTMRVGNLPDFKAARILEQVGRENLPLLAVPPPVPS